jgi:hypothetical protein
MEKLISESSFWLAIVLIAIILTVVAFIPMILDWLSKMEFRRFEDLLKSQRPVKIERFSVNLTRKLEDCFFRQSGAILFEDGGEFVFCCGESFKKACQKIREKYPDIREIEVYENSEIIGANSF